MPTINDLMVTEFANANVTAGFQAWRAANSLTGNDSMRTFMQTATATTGTPFNDLMIAYCQLP